jgi:RNA polymerase sigma-70 factor (ECF subfamily)
VVFNLALRISGDYDDAQDIAQSVFVKAYEKLETFDPAFEFFSWIYKMTLNESINLTNSRKWTTSLSSELPSPAHLPDERLMQDELQNEIGKALAELSIDQRAMIVLRHFADLSYRELGFVFNIAEKTVKSRLFSAREQLREILQHRGVAVNE